MIKRSIPALMARSVMAIAAAGTSRRVREFCFITSGPLTVAGILQAFEPWGWGKPEHNKSTIRRPR